jgi:phenylalanyl-tRNA synthetase beta chain
MNILVSDKWLRGYVKTPKTPEQIAAALSRIGPAVERIHRQGADLENVLVGKIVSIEKHPNADKLRIVIADIGSKKLRIVCGGSNLRDGQLIAVALVGARVRWHGEGELVTLEPATIRGEKSDGMICGANEIGLATMFPHAEREVMDITSTDAKPGTTLAKALGLGDAIYEIEVTTNRPDAFGVVGIAREVAAATGGTFVWKESKVESQKSKVDALKISIQQKKLCSRYQGALMENVTVKESPAWLKGCLTSAGARPINCVVDITNFAMLELGEPMHAFDADKVEGGIVVRNAKAGEKILALDGNTYTLKPEMLVIADAKKVLAVAGVIGGEASKVTEKTKRIILEAASFDATSVRRTARVLNLRTDAVMRFEKHVPQGLTSPALARAIQLVHELCGGTLVATVDVVGAKEKLPKVSIPLATLISRIGVKLSATEVEKLLASIGIKATVGTMVSATVPYWRAGDITIAEDLVEEVARLHGYDTLPSVLPPGVSGEAADPSLAWETVVRNALVGAGADDLINISLVGDELLAKSGEADAPTVRVANPLNVDLGALRPSHRARLLQTVRENEKVQQHGMVFEIGNVWEPNADERELPDEYPSLGIVVWGSDANFFRAKGLIERAASALRLPLTFARVESTNDFWHPGRSVIVHHGEGRIGMLGELTPDARANAGIESRAAYAELDLRELYVNAKLIVDFRAPSKFPPVLRDVAFICDRRTEHGMIVGAIKSIDPLITSVELFDHYEGKGIPEGKKNLGYHLTYQSPERTLNSGEVDAIHAKVATLLETKFKASIRQ